MRNVFGVPLICQILLTIILSGQNSLTCLRPHFNRKFNDDPPLDSVAGAGSSTLPIKELIDSIFRPASASSGNSSLVVHIDNLYCVTGSRDVHIHPCKLQYMNMARGNQVVNAENQRELSKRSPSRIITPLSKHVTNEPNGSGDTNGMYLGSTEEGGSQSEKYHIQSDGPRPTFEPLLNRYPHLQQSKTFENHESHQDGKGLSETQDSFRLEVPALNVFIDGKPITEPFKPKSHSSEELSSKLFKEELRELLLDENRNSVGKRLPCDREEPPCEDDMVNFRGGLELSYDEFRQIIDDVSERPDYVKLIVPGGVTGPLSGYFQKVDKSLHEHALVHGVCLLDNGLLVPLSAMLRILKLHAWLCQMVPDLPNEDVRKLHSSIKWTQTDSIADLLMCFVKSNKIHVVLPGRRKVPFALFEQEEEHVPKEVQKRAKVEMLGFHIPYTNFRDKLVSLCKGSSR